jgi:hypothetical protein
VLLKDPSSSSLVNTCKSHHVRQASR